MLNEEQLDLMSRIVMAIRDRDQDGIWDTGVDLCSRPVSEAVPIMAHALDVLNGIGVGTPERFQQIAEDIVRRNTH